MTDSQRGPSRGACQWLSKPKETLEPRNFRIPPPSSPHPPCLFDLDVFDTQTRLYHGQQDYRVRNLTPNIHSFGFLPNFFHVKSGRWEHKQVLIELGHGKQSLDPSKLCTTKLPQPARAVSAVLRCTSH